MRWFDTLNDGCYMFTIVLWHYHNSCHTLL